VYGFSFLNGTYIQAEIDDVAQDNNKQQQQGDDSLEFSTDDDINILSEWILIDWCASNKDSIDKDDDIAI